MDGDAHTSSVLAQQQAGVAGYPAQDDGSAAAAKSALDALQLQREVDTEILIEKEQTIQELRETVDVSADVLSPRSFLPAAANSIGLGGPVQILELKVKKLEQLVRIKDAKIGTMANQLQQGGFN